MSMRSRALIKVAVWCSAMLTGVAAAASPAYADDEADHPDPPARMSDVGGERLARPGVQADVPENLPGPPTVEAWSWIVADATSGQVLAAKNPHWPLAPASTLKILFADTVLPKLDRNTTRTVTPADLSGTGEGSSLVGIKEHLTYKVEDLWRGVFLRSGNDAVHVLCAMNGGVETTVREMNERARQLGATDTHVVTPDGYDGEGQVSSAYDLALFAREGLKNQDFRSYAATRIAEFPGEPGTTFQIQNTNTMLGSYPGMIGVKNGYTTNAQNTFVGAATRDGRTLIVSIMHVSGKGKTYEETARLLDWGFSVPGARPIGRLVEPEGAAAPSGGQTQGTPTSGPGTEAKDDGSDSPWLVVLGGIALVVAVGGGGMFLVRRRATVPAPAPVTPSLPLGRPLDGAFVDEVATTAPPPVPGQAPPRPTAAPPAVSGTEPVAVSGTEPVNTDRTIPGVTRLSMPDRRPPAAAVPAPPQGAASEAHDPADDEPEFPPRPPAAPGGS